MEEQINPINSNIKTLLDNLGSWFTQKKEIERIRVVTTKQSFWVSNPEKMKFWKGLAESQGHTLMGLKDNTQMPGVKITKVVFKNG